MNPRIKKMVDSFNDFHQKVSIGLPEILLILYTGISWSMRLLNPILLEHFERGTVILINFIFSVSLTVIFILISDFMKTDWYGKSKKSLTFAVIGLLSKSGNEKKILRYLFFLDSYLYYILSRSYCSGSIINIIKRWIMFLLSQLTVALTWLCIGIIINIIGWSFFLLIVFLIFLVIKKILKIKSKRVM